MSLFSRDNRRLQRLFPSTGRTVPAPGELSESINLIHEYPGRIWESLASAQIPIGPALTPTGTVIDLRAPGNFGALGPLNEDGDYVEIVAGDISHDSATVRNVQLALFSPNNQNIFIARWINFATVLGLGVSGFEPLFGQASFALAVAANTTRILPPWPLFVPPLFQLRVFGDTAAIAYTITVSIVARIHPLSERPIAL